jgi:hypothetical protein
MDRYYAFDTPEAVAFRHLTFVAHSTHEAIQPLMRRTRFSYSENLFTWDLDHPSLPETIVAGCAAYVALQRYLTRPEEVVIAPRNIKDIGRILYATHYLIFDRVQVTYCFGSTQLSTRYSIDEIHNILSSSRRSLQDGGYTRVSACLASTLSPSSIFPFPRHQRVKHHQTSVCPLEPHPG